MPWQNRTRSRSRSSSRSSTNTVVDTEKKRREIGKLNGTGGEENIGKQG